MVHKLAQRLQHMLIADVVDITYLIYTQTYSGREKAHLTLLLGTIQGFRAIYGKAT